MLLPFSSVVPVSRALAARFRFIAIEKAVGDNSPTSITRLVALELEELQNPRRQELSLGFAQTEDVHKSLKLGIERVARQLASRTEFRQDNCSIFALAVRTACELRK